MATSVAHGLAVTRAPGHRRLAWCMLTAAVATAAAGAIAASGSADDPVAVGLARAFIVGVPLAVGLYTWCRREEQRFGLLLAATGCGLLVATLAESGDSLAYTVGRTAGWLVELLIVYLILSFPTGRVRDPVDRMLVGAMGVATAIVLLPQLLLAESFAVPSPYTSCTSDCPANAFMVTGREPAIFEDAMVLAGAVLVIAVMIGVLVRLALRIRDATPLSRRMATPVIAISTLRVALVAVALLGREVDPSAWAVEAAAWLVALALPAIAIAFLAAIVSWRLFAGEALERLAEQLMTAPDAPRLQRAVAEALGDPSLQLAFPAGPGIADWLDCWGQPMSLPVPGEGLSVSDVYHDGALVAVIVHDETLDANRRLVEASGTIAGVVLDNQRLIVETDASTRRERRSSARLAAGADRERRRIERDLHDGAQQRLVALGIELELAEGIVRKDPETAIKRLRELKGDVDDALEELRSLAHGVYPPLLADRGLVEALRAIAARSPIAVGVEAHDVGRHPAEVEGAVYFCVLEALQNALKHAQGAHRVSIRLEHQADLLRFSVRDDGPGGAIAPGSGITNMQDRVAAVGGMVGVSSAPAVGTTVRGWVPASGLVATNR
jgi:signal transduction histidine kinase